TWARPAPDAAWTELTKVIRRASERALRTLFQAPPGAFAAEPISAWHANLTSLGDAKSTQLRGMLWLAGPAGVPGTVQLRTPLGTGTFAVPRGVAVSGSLLVHVAQDEQHTLEVLDRALGELCAT